MASKCNMMCLTACARAEPERRAVTSCGHAFCSDCIHEIIPAGAGCAPCPICRCVCASSAAPEMLFCLRRNNCCPLMLERRSRRTSA
eukprot:1157578-Pelagomonas_calceolata.AAC.5